MVLIPSPARKQEPRFGWPLFMVGTVGTSASVGAPCFYRESGDLFTPCLFIIPVPVPEDKQDVQRSTEWAITQSGAQGGRLVVETIHIFCLGAEFL